MNPLSLLALFGSTTWILSELLERTVGTGPLSLALTTVAFATLSAGTWGLGGSQVATSSWRLSAGALSGGFALMAVVAARMWGSGTASHPEDALFFGGIALFAVGMLSVAGVVVASGRHPRAVGLAFGALALLSLGANAAEVGPLASAANVALSLVMVRMAWPSVHPTPAQGILAE